MKKARKKEGKRIEAYVLGAGSETERSMSEKGRIRLREDGKYELFSQEVKGTTGQLASAGDYFKLDNAGFPYPNEKSWFERNHRHLEGDCYEQIPKTLNYWDTSQSMAEEVRYLLNAELLKICPDSPEKYFEAELWGTLLHGNSSSIIMFYEIQRREDGEIENVDFNIVSREEFEKTYLKVTE